MTLSKFRLLSVAVAALLTVSLSMVADLPPLGPTAADAVTPTNPECQTQVPDTPITPAQANDYMLNLDSLNLVYDPPGNPYAAGPGAVGYDTVYGGAPARRLSVPFSGALDVASAPLESQVVTSENGGATFSPTADAAGIPSTYTTRLRSGTLFSIEFKPSSGTDTTATFAVHRSNDNGASWTTSSATYTAPAGRVLQQQEDGNRMIRVHEQPLELADGTILVSVYLAWSVASPHYTNNTGTSPVTYYMTSAEVMASTDGGSTFTRRGVIGAGTSNTAYSEAGLGQRPDGSLISVIRTSTLDDFVAPTSNVLLPLSYSSSNDGGTTWSAPTQLKVAGLDGTTTPATRAAIFPSLNLLPNGVMVLTAGRHDNWAAYSPTGAGTDWKGALTFRNCEYDGFRDHGSSGNSSLTWVGSNRVVQTVDTCHNGPSYCHNSDGTLRTDLTVTNQNQIWERYVDILTPDTGKIDLASKVAAGSISVVSSNMNWASATRPRTTVAGAFDGSNEYWSSAVHAGSDPGTVVLKLDRDQRLSRVGLSLRNGRTESARVYTSMDGVTWGTPVVTAANRTHYALEYFPLTARPMARYVKVEVDPASDCDSEIAATCSFLNELELYSNVDSFENDPMFNRPRGYDASSVSSWITTSYAGDSDRVLEVYDQSTTALAKASAVSTAASTRTLSFKLNPVSIGSAMLFEVLGNDSAGAQVAAFHMGVFADGSIQKYTRRTDGTYVWFVIAPAGTVPMNAWSELTITANSANGSGTLSLNGVLIATNMAATNATTSLNGHLFASGGTAPKDVFVVDDVVSE